MFSRKRCIFSSPLLLEEFLALKNHMSVLVLRASFSQASRLKYVGGMMSGMQPAWRKPSAHERLLLRTSV